MIAPAPVSLPVVPSAIAAADVRAPGDFFRCVPLGTKLFARACQERRRLAVAPAERSNWSHTGGGGGRSHLAVCRTCADGAAIAKRLGN